MPRSRFKKLPPEKQRVILDAAGDAFAAHGYEGASYNHIIEVAQVSKGAMYYYFEDKSDLFLATLFDALEPMMSLESAPPAVEDAPSFWEAAQAYTLSLWGAAAQSPKGMALARAALSASGPTSEAIAEMVAKVEAVTVEWLKAGQGVGAVRSDLPLGLLSAMLLGLGQGFDTWLLNHIEELSEGEAGGIMGSLTPIFKAVVEPR